VSSPRPETDGIARGRRGVAAQAGAPSSRSVYLGGMSNGLRDTVALVTGASSGIGEATARALAAQGAKVAVVARRRDRLDALAAEIAGLAIETDVTDREQALAAVERTVQELGRLDIVINNAGVMLLGPIVDAPVEEWDRMIELNLQGLLYVAHAALRTSCAPPSASRAGSRTSSTSARSRAGASEPAAASTSSPSTASGPSARPCARRSRLATSVRR
jgi:NAD(P)-dependent dehydrogenase (short-subunit alcohol dehydrogenase family)